MSIKTHPKTVQLRIRNDACSDNAVIYIYVNRTFFHAVEILNLKS